MILQQHTGGCTHQGRLVNAGLFAKRTLPGVLCSLALEECNFL